MKKRSCKHTSFFDRFWFPKLSKIWSKIDQNSLRNRSKNDLENQCNSRGVPGVKKWGPPERLSRFGAGETWPSMERKERERKWDLENLSVSICFSFSLSVCVCFYLFLFIFVCLFCCCCSCWKSNFHQFWNPKLFKIGPKSSKIGPKIDLEGVSAVTSPPRSNFDRSWNQKLSKIDPKIDQNWSKNRSRSGLGSDFVSKLIFWSMLEAILINFWCQNVPKK